MDKVNRVFKGLVEFIQIFIIKYEYEIRGQLKKMKIDSRLNLEIEDERWCKLFRYKSCYNHCAKFILLKNFEDSGYIPQKISDIGLERWKEFTKNLTFNYSILYSIAIKDLQADQKVELRNAFKESDYDIFTIDNELSDCLINYFSSFDFSELPQNEIIQLFRLIYPLEQREDYDLENFYKRAPAFDYILKWEKTNTS